MRKIKKSILLLCIFPQTLSYCSNIKIDSVDSIKIKKRSRSESFLDSLPSSPSTYSILYKSPRPSQKSTFTAYNALLENKLQPSERLFHSFSEEIDHLQKYWNEQHLKHISPELFTEMGKHAALLLNLDHLFKPQVRTQEGAWPKFYGFHHDPEKIIEQSGLVWVHTQTDYPDYCYKQKLHTQTEPEIHTRKTFFPDSWSRQETLGALLLALQNAKKCGPNIDDINREFEGTAHTKPPICITIRLRVMQDKACICTAYPKH